MFGLFLPFVLAAVIPIPTPQPTLPPEIGNVYVRGHCSEGQRSLVRVLPILIRNDNTIGNAQTGLAKLDSSNEPSTRLTITRTRTMSNQIFKNLDQAKDEVMKLHVLAAATTNPDESKRFTAVADSLDTIIAQQSAVADQYNGFADTADMGMLYQGGETERQMNRGNGPDSPTAIAMQKQQQARGSLADTNVGALTTNVFRDVQTMRGQLAQTEAQTSTQVHDIIKTCAPPKRKQ